MTLDPDQNLLAQDTGAANTDRRERRPSRLKARSKLAAVLAVLACAGCCAVPVLVPFGVLTAGGVAAATTGFTVVAVILFVGAALMWVLHLRAKRRADAQHDCAAGDCACSS